jgi:hypothetical protein
MKRNLIITIDPQSVNNNVIFINDIDNIVNYSCDSIEISILEYIEDKNHKMVIGVLAEKIRPSGKLIINISNAISIAKNFVSYSITSQNFLNFFKNKVSLLSIDLLYSMIDFDSMFVIDTDIKEDHITLILERKPI